MKTKQLENGLAFAIKNIDKGTWFVSDGRGRVTHTKTLDKACLFYDEDEAESVNEGLNSKMPDCYQLINLKNEDGKVGHTAGNWYAKDGQVYPEETGKTLALIPYFDRNDKEQAANAKLIAAAPDLLEALQSALGFIEEGMQDNDEPDPLFDSLMDRINGAISKATC